MKRRLRIWLLEGRFSEISALAESHKRTLSFLTALTYDPHPLVAWRAVSALGLAAASVARDDPEYVRVHMRRLLWLLTDESGGVGWHAPEALGEILHACPGQFPEFIPLLLSLFDLEPEDLPPFLPGLLWAVGRLAQVDPDAAAPVRPQVLDYLSHPDPQVRGLALWCISHLPCSVPQLLPELFTDPTTAEIYHSGEITRCSLASLAQGVAEQSEMG